MVEASKAHLDQLQAYEKQGETLARAASAGNLQAVLLYWQYLQDFADLLQVRVQQDSSRIEDLTAQLLFLRKELVNNTLGLNPNSDDSVSNAQLDALDQQLELKDKDITAGVAKLSQRDRTIASVRSRLEGLWKHLGETEKEVTLSELLADLERRIAVMLD